MKMLAVSALLCALLVLTRAASIAEGQNDPDSAELTAAPSVGPPEADGLPFDIIPPSVGPTLIHDDFGFHGLGENDLGFSCPEGWTMFSTHCLLHVQENMTWVDAEANCESGNGNFNAYGNLASVLEEFHFGEIQGLMQLATNQSGQAWVGGFRKPENNSSWSWSDYMPDVFPNWCSGEPSKENCLTIKFEVNANGCLEGSSCDAELPSICGIVLM